ncbi:MAG: glycoside hydrolase family 5 protein [Novosphingobium sp.]|nr:glycoside hydrolase family 5 protein [Novosphingobium sp.]
MRHSPAKAALSAIATLAMLHLAGAASAQPAAQVPARTDALPVGACINMGNHLESPSEGAWGRAIADDDFAIIAKAGFKTVRLPVRWTAHLDSADRIDPALLDRVGVLLAQARKARLNVILNDHNFDALMADPEGQRMRLATVWQQVATRFAAEPREHVWFEIANEPHDKLTNANLLATLGPALAAIRQSNPDRPVIIGGENWSGINSLATLQLPDDPHIVPTVHYYDPFEFTHQGATWVSPSPKMGRMFGSAADKAQLAADVEKLRSFARRTGKTPFIGEFGAIDKIGRKQRVLYMSTVRKAWAEAGAGTCAWAYTNTFPLYHSGSGKWIRGMRAAMGLAE